VNSTTACNTGSCGGPDGPSCTVPAHKETSRNEPPVEETDQVWIEAGFLPPAGYRQAVALLHRLAMNGEPVAPLLSHALTAAPEILSGPEHDQNYRVLNPAKLRRTAEEFGIDLTDRNNTEIARAVTLAIIGEYGVKKPEDHI
jgi:hypothetical protein